MLGCVQFFMIPWMVAHQAHLSMEFSRQEITIYVYIMNSICSYKKLKTHSFPSFLHYFFFLTNTILKKEYKKIHINYFH